MFEQMKNQQAVADGLKGLVHQKSPTPDARRDNQNAVKRINQFEAARWNPIAFETALETVKGLTGATGERGGVTFTWEGQGRQLGPAIHKLLDTYYQVLGEPEVELG
jgi:hypothetical protein